MSNLSQQAKKAVATEAESEEHEKEAESDTMLSFTAWRELLESLVFALFLAFSIKIYEVEPFVIPTGSMAPTLMGRHKDVHCQECGFRFQVNASEEMDNSTNRATSARIVAATCPNCFFTQYFGNEEFSYTGDRILVSKVAFDTRALRRWDVSVFRAPAEPKFNFIKRIVGLPNERLRIQYGDIFVQKPLENGKWSDFEIMRKPMVQLKQMLQTVHDNDFQSDTLSQRHWPPRWSDQLTELKQGVSGWLASEDGKRFHFTGTPVNNSSAFPASGDLALSEVVPEEEFKGETADFQWLRYRHIVTLSRYWNEMRTGVVPEEVSAPALVRWNPQLITDVTAYNTGMAVVPGETWDDYSRYVRKVETGTGESWQCRRPSEAFGCNWAGDLGLECEMTFSEETFREKGEVIFDLVKGGVTFRCRIHLRSGKITLQIPELSEYLPETASCTFGKGTWHFLFLNVDEQMRLLVNGREVEFSNEGKYDHLCQPLPDGRPGILARNRDPNEKDLLPVAIGAAGVDVELAHLKIWRDIYYIARGTQVDPVHLPENRLLLELGGGRCDRLVSSAVPFSEEEDFARFYSSPRMWAGYGNTLSATFPLAQDQYLALGDNSGLSHDSRLWSSATVPYYVDRKYLIGKAFYVYWPHGKRIPGTKFPWIPSFGRMRSID
ncbi:MAG: S26 family signal peptidase [Planctomycetia bacterium]|nr:S26 family signal peptidase [Planctomycetia bacterium]